MKIAILLGTRPEIIKFYPIIKEIKRDDGKELVIVHSGQHFDYEMSSIFFEELQIPEPDVYLNVKLGSSHGVQTSQIVTNFEKFLLEKNFDVVLVLGDTNTALAGALAAAKQQIPVGHVESGCRSFDMSMPEEVNRVLIDRISRFCFAPSYTAYLNLISEGIPQQNVFLSGDTLKEVFGLCLKLSREVDFFERTSIPLPDAYGIITLHRQENTDNPVRLKNILGSLKELEQPLLFPIHPRTKKRVKEYGLEKLLQAENIIQLPPLGYLTFLNAASSAEFILTDSGGLQVEAAMLQKPTLTFRMNTEWPETLWAGYNHLVGARKELIVQKFNDILEGNLVHKRNLNDYFPRYNASTRILELLEVEMASQDRFEGRGTSYFSDMIDRGYPFPHLIKVKREGMGRESLPPLGRMAFDEEGNPMLIFDEGDESNFDDVRLGRTSYLLSWRFHRDPPSFINFLKDKEKVKMEKKNIQNRSID